MPIAPSDKQIENLEWLNLERTLLNRSKSLLKKIQKA